MTRHRRIELACGHALHIVTRGFTFALGLDGFGILSNIASSVGQQ